MPQEDQLPALRNILVKRNPTLRAERDQERSRTLGEANTVRRDRKLDRKVSGQKLH